MNVIKKLDFEIQGMTCDSCAQHVENALRSVSGVKSASVPDWKSEKAIVEAHESVNVDKLEKAVADAGYQAKLKKSKSQTENSTNFDLMILGGGSAGFAAAIKATDLGFNAAIVNDGKLGGTCVNIGCVPSKTLIRAMESFYQAGQHHFEGIQTMAGHINWSKVVAHKDELIDDMRQTKYADVLKSYPNITLLEGRATLDGDHSLSVNGKTYRYHKLILATGASPKIPNIPGLSETPFLTSTTALSLTELPRSLIVLGANAVGLELAQMYARAGTHVSVIEIMPRIAPFEDAAISEALHKALVAERLRIFVNFKSTNVSFRNGRFYLSAEDGTQLTADNLLVATGRRPNTTDMGLEEAGVNLGKQGEVLVDEKLQTSLPDVYAAGDITGRDMFVYVAAYAAGVAAENALVGAERTYDSQYIPRIIFTDPQLASVGLTEAQAQEQGFQIRVSTLPMEHVPAAQVTHDHRGLIKLVVNRENDQILGGHIFSPNAGDMIQVLVLAMRFGISAQQLRETMFPYLTHVEGIKLAVLGLEKDISKLSCCAG